MSETTLRCAIYTRKSSEEGLDQDFNSLDAQREACEASRTSGKSNFLIEHFPPSSRLKIPCTEFRIPCSVEQGISHFIT